MKTYEIKTIAMKLNLDVRNLDRTGTIRAIQEAEGNDKCFKTDVKDCPRKECLWYEDCMKK
jgi:hypothetical protein